MFIGYSKNSLAYKVYNVTQTIVQPTNTGDQSSYSQELEIQNLEEHVETTQNTLETCAVDFGNDSQTKLPVLRLVDFEPITIGCDILEEDSELINSKQPSTWIQQAYSQCNLLSDLENGMLTRRRLAIKLRNVATLLTLNLKM